MAVPLGRELLEKPISTPLNARRQPPTTTDGSRGLEWLWQHISDLRPPCFLDCGETHPPTLKILLSRATKVYVASLVPWLAGDHPELWDRSQRTPVFRLPQLLGRFPEIPFESLAAVFCWQLLDLVPPEAQAGLVERLLAFLRPGGALFCLVREPALVLGAGVTWNLESLTSLIRHDHAAVPFAYPPLTNRQMEKLAGKGDVKTFLTRSGIREVLILK